VGAPVRVTVQFNGVGFSPAIDNVTLCRDDIPETTEPAPWDLQHPNAECMFIEDGSFEGQGVYTLLSTDSWDHSAVFGSPLIVPASAYATGGYTFHGTQHLIGIYVEHMSSGFGQTIPDQYVVGDTYLLRAHVGRAIQLTTYTSQIKLELRDASDNMLATYTFDPNVLAHGEFAMVGLEYVAQTADANKDIRVWFGFTGTGASVAVDLVQLCKIPAT